MRCTLISVLVLCLGVGAGADAQTATPRPSPRKPAVPATPKPTTPRPTPAAAPPPPPATDVKVVTAYTQGAQVSENTTYVRGPRQRVEFPGMVSLDQCDLERLVLLNPAIKRYRVQPYAPTPSASVTASDPKAAQLAAMQAAMQGATPARAVQSGVVTVITTLTDTGERQTLFGLDARHIRTVVTRTPSKDACEKVPVRTEVDAWYVDLPGSTKACARPTPAEPAPSEPAADCQDTIESRVEGAVTLGFPVKTLTTITTGEGSKQESSSTSADVTALDVTRLDAALFEVPADFTEAASLVELTPSVSAGGSLADALFGSTADGTSTASPKLAGRTRIGVLEPVNKSGRDGLQMRALRQELVTRFTKGTFDALPLKGTAVDGVAPELARLECDYVLVSEVVEVKTSKPGKVGGMMRRASGGDPTKDRHEVKMAYRLYPADGAAAVKLSGDVKTDDGGLSMGIALRLAAFAGQMYMGFGMIRGFGGTGGLGMGMGMMNPMYGLASTGSMGAMGGSFYDPRSMAMNSMTMGMAAGTMGAVDEAFPVAADAAGEIAKNVTEKLRSGK